MITIGTLFLFNFKQGKDKKFNCILIVIDALRTDHLGCYGYSRNTSPNIDKFAKEGAIFTKAFSQGPATKISIPSIFTSLYAGVHKVLKLDSSLAEKLITLPEVLKEYGYTTAAFVGLPLANLSNFSYRFDLYEINTLERRPDNVPIWECSFEVTPWINEKAISWLKKNRTNPFFLYLHYYDVHTPYLPPPPYNEIFWPGGIDGETKNFVINFFGRGRWGDLNSSTDPKGRIFDYILSQYDGEIRYVDEHIKTLLEELERLDLSKNTLVILTADHGEEFKDHGNFFHGNSLYDELIHVPLIMRLPEIIPKHRVIPNLIRHIDIMPTILDILNIRNNNPMQGVSFLSLFVGKNQPELDVFSEGYFRGKHLIGVRTDKWKLIESDDFGAVLSSTQLYDLKEDPKELNNLIEENLKEAGLLKDKLRDYTLSCERMRKQVLGDGFIDKPAILGKETKEQLKSLGYIQ